jgi:hypothetical protein
MPAPALRPNIAHFDREPELAACANADRQSHARASENPVRVQPSENAVLAVDPGR